MYTVVQRSAGTVLLLVLFVCALPFQFLQSEENEVMQLTLEIALKIADRENLEIISAQKNYTAKRARYFQSIAPVSPEYYMENSGMPRFRSIVRDYGERWSGIIQNIEFPIKWYLRGKSEQKHLQALEMDYALVLLNIHEKVREGYYRLLAKQKHMIFEQNNLHLLKDFEEKAHIRFEVGEGSQLEVIRAKVEVAKAQGNVLIAQNDYALAEANLKFLLNKDNRTSLVLLDSMRFEPVTKDLSALQEFAFQNHPSGKSARFLYEESGVRQTYSYSSFLPDFYIGLFRLSYGNRSEGKRWASQIGLNIPIWFFFRERNEIQQARTEREGMEAVRELANKTIALEVEKAYKDLKANESRVKLYETSIISEAKEIYRIAAESYQEGEIGYIELIEAQRTLINAQKDYIGSLYDYQETLGALIKAVGGKLP